MKNKTLEYHISKDDLADILKDSISACNNETALLDDSNPDTDYCDFEVGKNYFIRTVTHYHLGSVVGEGKMFLHCKNSAWIADTKRFHKFVQCGIIDDGPEVELYPADAIVKVNKHAIIDSVEWKHAMPTESQ